MRAHGPTHQAPGARAHAARGGNAGSATRVGAALIGGALVALGAACLPDLPADAPRLTSDASLRGQRFCGDGVVHREGDGGAPPEECDPGEAGAAGCSNECRIVCEGVQDTRTGHCYFSPNAASSFQEAVSTCARNGAHVVTLADSTELSFVSSRFGSAFWVGLSNDSVSAALRPPPGVNEPGYPNAPQTGPCEGCFAAGVDDAGQFALMDAAPDADGRDLACLVNERMRWLRTACFTPTSYTIVCEREPAGSHTEACNGGFCITAFSAPSIRWLFVPSPSSGADAAATCALLGGKLAVLPTVVLRQELARELAALFPPNVPASVWVGLLDEGTSDGGFRWDDGQSEQAYPSSWGDREPAGDGARRAYMHFTPGRYDTTLLRADPAPGAARPFVCQLSP